MLKDSRPYISRYSSHLLGRVEIDSLLAHLYVRTSPNTSIEFLILISPVFIQSAQLRSGYCILYSGLRAGSHDALRQRVGAAPVLCGCGVLQAKILGVLQGELLLPCSYPLDF
uniref:Uncharacterized protein n=1 Tax=Pararge aegeria TaxID=116150 RepID=S4PAI4_9NEOP